MRSFHYHLNVLFRSSCYDAILLKTPKVYRYECKFVYVIIVIITYTFNDSIKDCLKVRGRVSIVLHY